MYFIIDKHYLRLYMLLSRCNSDNIIYSPTLKSAPVMFPLIKHHNSSSLRSNSTVSQCEWGANMYNSTTTSTSVINHFLCVLFTSGMLLNLCLKVWGVSRDGVGVVERWRGVGTGQGKFDMGMSAACGTVTLVCVRQARHANAVLWPANDP